MQITVYSYSTLLRLRCCIVFVCVTHTELNDVLQVCSEGGILPAPLIDSGPTSQLVQVTFIPRYQCEVSSQNFYYAVSLARSVDICILCLLSLG